VSIILHRQVDKLLETPIMKQVIWWGEVRSGWVRFGEENTFKGDRMSKYDAVIPRLAMSAREFILKNIRLRDKDLAKELTRAGFPASTNAVTRFRQRILGIEKTGGLNCHIIDDSIYTLYDRPLEYTGDACVLGDIEFPFQHAPFINRVMDICQIWKIPHVVFGGDLIHNDSLTPFDPPWTADVSPESVSSEAHDKLTEFGDKLKGQTKKEYDEMLEKMGIHAESPHSGLSMEWKVAGEQIQNFRHVFSSADWDLGNHEGRVLRVLQSPLVPTTLRDMIVPGAEWIRIAPYYYSIVHSGGKDFRITHPKNTSVKPVSIAYSLCDKFDCNIIQLHNHLLGMAISRNGKYIAIESGCCVDGRRLPYYSQRDTTRPLWSLGATIIRDGHAWLLDDVNTDWEALKRL
jgi:hypothetical protein